MPRTVRIALAALLLTLAEGAPRARLLSAQEPPAEPDPVTPPGSTAGPTAPEPPARRPPDPLDAFVPHERVEADSIVALPVDI